MRTCSFIAILVASFVGCQRAVKEAPVATSIRSSTAPTFTADIAPILRARCVNCHRPNAAGPFALVTFDDVSKRADQLDLAIPADDASYRTTFEYTLPIDVEATAVLPHAHYLGKRLTGYAMLPDGTKQWLIHISDWDFKWQGEYRYAKPLMLPQGTQIVMDFQYDNSASNPRNPNSPPKQVNYGPEATDEMAELALQVVTNSARERQILARDFDRWRLRNELIPQCNRVLATSTDPDEIAAARLNLGKTWLSFGDLDRAISELTSAASKRDVETYYYLGRAQIMKGMTDEGKQTLQQAMQIEPEHPDVLNGLGLIALQEKDYGLAINYFTKFVAVEPRDATGHLNLGIALIQASRISEAQLHLHKSLQIEPNQRKARSLLERIEATK